MCASAQRGFTTGQAARLVIGKEFHAGRVRRSTKLLAQPPVSLSPVERFGWLIQSAWRLPTTIESFVATSALIVAHESRR